MLSFVTMPTLDFLLLETMLPDRHEGSDAVLAVVEKDNPTIHVSCGNVSQCSEGCLHSIRIHRLADQELVILEIPNNLLREPLRTRLELLHLVVARSPFLHSLLHLLHV